MGFGIIELLLVALIALGVGYIVSHLAGKPEGGSQGFGKIIGRAIMIVSTIVLILTLYILANVMIRAMIGPRMQAAGQERVVKPSPIQRTVVK